MKRELIYMRKQVWPIRELISSIVKGEFALVQESSYIFFNDVYDHTIQAIDTIESYRDVLSGLLDLYLSTVSNRMNEVMKVLTIIATIFIPITFVAGIYGMNFKYMPELEWKAGYFMVWGVIALVVVVMISYFKDTPGYNILWKDLNMIWDLEFDSFKPTYLPKELLDNPWK